MPKATWKGTVLAESERTIVVEGNHYFPRRGLVLPPCRKDAAAQIKDHVAFWRGVVVDV